jgi:hypothetical protein
MVEIADELERWGANNADESQTEGDVPEERYKAFQLAVHLIRAALDRTAPNAQPGE